MTRAHRIPLGRLLEAVLVAGGRRGWAGACWRLYVPDMLPYICQVCIMRVYLLDTEPHVS